MSFFHGTDAVLAVGDTLYPGDALGVSVNKGDSAHVYMTTDEFVPVEGDATDMAIGEAYAWARTACMIAEDERGEECPTAFVYIVEPIGTVGKDAHEDVGQECVRADAALIVGIIDSHSLLSHDTGFGDTYIY